MSICSCVDYILHGGAFSNSESKCDEPTLRPKCIFYRQPTDKKLSQRAFKIGCSKNHIAWAIVIVIRFSRYYYWSCSPPCGGIRTGSFHILLSHAGLRHLGKGWIVRDTTTRRVPYTGLTGSSTRAGTGFTNLHSLSVAVCQALTWQQSTSGDRKQHQI